MGISFKLIEYKSEIDEAGAIMTLRCTVFHDSPAFTAKYEGED